MTGTIFRQGTDITQGLLNLRMPLPRSSLREWRCFFTTLSFLSWYSTGFRPSYVCEDKVHPICVEVLYC